MNYAGQTIRNRFLLSYWFFTRRRISQSFGIILNDNARLRKSVWKSATGQDGMILLAGGNEQGSTCACGIRL
jgi:hypothetical protein